MPKNHVSGMKFAEVYPLYVQKAERKNRTKEEVDQIKDPLMQKLRCLDELIDELAKGKAMEKIVRR